MSDGGSPEDYPDEEPLSEAEEAYGYAYADMLAVGAPEPSDAHLDPARAARIREVLDAVWGRKVRTITRRRRRR